MSVALSWLPADAEQIRYFGDDNLIYQLNTETKVAEVYGVRSGVKLTGEVRIPESVSYNGDDYTVVSVGIMDAWYTVNPYEEEETCFYRQV